MSNFKKISALTCAIFLFLTASTVSAVDTRAMEIPQEIGAETAFIPTTEWTCLSNTEYETPMLWKKLKSAFIKNPMQRITQVCMYGSTVYGLMEEEKTNGDRLTFGGIYLLEKNKKYVERKGHRIMSFCELVDTSAAKKLRVNYLCYSPQVAAAYSQGEEWSFRITSSLLDKRGSGFASPSDTKEGGRVPAKLGELVGETLVSPRTKRRTYERDCTVFFSSEEKKKCGKWRRVK